MWVVFGGDMTWHIARGARSLTAESRARRLKDAHVNTQLSKYAVRDWGRLWAFVSAFMNILRSWLTMDGECDKLSHIHRSGQLVAAAPPHPTPTLTMFLLRFPPTPSLVDSSVGWEEPLEWFKFSLHVLSDASLSAPHPSVVQIWVGLETDAVDGWYQSHTNTTTRHQATRTHTRGRCEII